MNFSCKTCEDRHQYCHSTCEIYNREKRNRKRLVDKYNKAKEADYYSMDRVMKCRNKTAIERKRRATKGGTYGIYD